MLPTPSPDPHRVYWTGVFSGIGAGTACALAWALVDHIRLIVPRPVEFLGGIVCVLIAGLLIGYELRDRKR